MKEKFNNRYEVIGRVDGYWTVQGFDRHNKPLGAKVVCRLPSEAWKVFFMLNGMGDPNAETEEHTEVTYVDQIKVA